MEHEKVTYTKADLFYLRLHEAIKAAIEQSYNSFENWLCALQVISVQLTGFLRKEKEEAYNEEHFKKVMEEVSNDINDYVNSNNSNKKNLNGIEIRRKLLAINADLIFVMDKYHLLLPKGKLQGGKELLDRALGFSDDDNN